MSPSAIPANDAAKMNTREMFGMSLSLLPEPEVLQAELAQINCKSLASVIVKLIAEHEPMLKAEADGTTITVRELGGTVAMTFTVSA